MPKKTPPAGGIGQPRKDPIGANGGAPTWSHMLQLEQELATLNADVGSIG